MVPAVGYDFRPWLARHRTRHTIFICHHNPPHFSGSVGGKRTTCSRSPAPTAADPFQWSGGDGAGVQLIAKATEPRNLRGDKMTFRFGSSVHRSALGCLNMGREKIVREAFKVGGKVLPKFERIFTPGHHLAFALLSMAKV